MTVIHTLRGKSFVETEDESRIYMLEGKTVKDELPKGFILQRGELALDPTSGETIGIAFRMPNTPEIQSMMNELELRAVQEEWFGPDDDELHHHVVTFSRIVDNVMSKFPGFESFLSGLVGELIVLKGLLEHSTSETMKSKWVDSWTGYTKTSRDFLGEKIAIEVKTTTQVGSRHKMSNLNQTSLKDTEGGTIEKLLLASVSIDRTMGDLTLPQVVDEILDLFPSDVDASLFLNRVTSYGGSSGPLYIHGVHRDFEAYRQSTFCVNFIRIYDLGDHRILIPRKSTFEGLDHLDVSTLSFVIELPDVVGFEPNNPIGLENIVNDYSHLLD